VKEKPPVKGGLVLVRVIANDKDYTALTMLEKIRPTAGPRRAKMTITTTATKTRIKAYSTRPWPFSFGANNIWVHLLSMEFGSAL
jgi:hypothetical protein